ncbi:MAG: DivIVA domain-containing protein [Actinomycetota bacterium]|nr:DivIVA domain-containing protein [Actinomycetota bacterium]
MERESAPGLLPVTDPSALPTFDVALRGYDRRQVDEYLERIERDLAMVQADRAAAVSNARAMEQRLTELQRDLQAERERLVEAGQPTYAGLGAKAEQFLRIAEEESARLRAEAERAAAGVRTNAEAILKDAEAKAAAAERDLEAALANRRRQADEEAAAQQAEREQGQAAAQRHVADAEALVEQRMGEATTEASRIVSEASTEGERLRREAEQQGTSLIQSARSEAEGLVAQAKAEAEGIVAAGRAAADQERAVADKKIAALLRRRTDITRQLKTLRDVLGSMPDNEDAADEEPDQPPDAVQAPAQPTAQQASPPAAAPSAPSAAPSARHALRVAHAEPQTPSVAAAMAPAPEESTGDSVVGAARRDTGDGPTVQP